MTHAFDVSGLVVDEMDSNDTVLADARQQAIVVEKVRRQTIVIDEVREKLLLGEIHLETMPMASGNFASTVWFVLSICCHWAFE